MPFPISCGACGATFNIPDDIYQRRVAGRVVSIRCKQCKADIQVDGTSHGPDRQDGASSAPPSPPAVAETPVATAPSTEAQPQTRNVPARQERPVEEAIPEPTRRSEPPSAPAREEPSAPASHAVDAAMAEAAVTPPARPTPAPADEPRTGSSHSADTAQSAAPALDESGLAPSTATTAREEAHVEKSSVKEKIAASRRAREERAARRAARKLTPASQKAAEIGQAPHTETPADLWAVSFGDDDDRELTEAQIATEIRHGTLHRDTLVWREGMEGWQRLGQVPRLARLLPREEPGETAEAAPARARVTPVTAPVAMPPPLARTTLGVGPVTLPEPVVAPAVETRAASSPVPTPGPSAAAVTATPVAAPAVAVLAQPPVFGSGVEAAVRGSQPAAPNPFMDNPLLTAPQVPAGAALQRAVAAPPVAPAPRPVALDLEALPPVKTGRPVLWITAIVVVVALGLVIGVMSSWLSPPHVAAPTATTPSPSAAVADSPAVVRESPSPPPRTAASSSTTQGSQVDLFSPPGPAAKTKPNIKKGSTRKPDLADVFADKLQGKGSKR